MKELEYEFTGTGEVSNVIFRQLNASEKGYIYMLIDIETEEIRYEVFERKIQKESEMVIRGKVIKYEEKVKYPKSKDFGVWAWCYNNFDKALLKFSSL